MPRPTETRPWYQEDPFLLSPAYERHIIGFRGFGKQIKCPLGKHHFKTQTSERFIETVAQFLVD